MENDCRLVGRSLVQRLALRRLVPLRYWPWHPEHRNNTKGVYALALPRVVSHIRPVLFARIRPVRVGEHKHLEMREREWSLKRM